MRFAIVGSGAVGGYFGAKLVRAGHEVTFLARGAHLKALRERGLEVQGPLGDFLVPVRAEEDASRVPPVDVVLLAVKTYDNATALPMVKTLLSTSSPGAGEGLPVVLPLQNGVDSPSQLAAEVGESSVLGGFAYISTTLVRPGVILQTGTHQRIGLGEFFGDTSRLSPRVEALRDALAGAGVEVLAEPDARVPLWEKFIFLVPLAGFTGAARVPVGSLRSDAHIRASYRAAIEEVLQVARAEGVPVAIEADDIERQVATLPATARSSLLADLESGKPIEVEALQGSVARRGRALGVRTPVIDTLYAVLKPHEHGRRQG
ncbi:ketopantoate reductase family protein [Myxococcaceae bacterium GXIMD 01537]